MQTVKRVEIITDSVKMREIRAILEENEVEGYTIIRNVIGKGGRGMQSGDELTGVFTNTYLLTTCAPEKIEELVGSIRPVLKQSGGICLVSDAQSVRH